jgi:hypothetical protein
MKKSETADGSVGGGGGSAMRSIAAKYVLVSRSSVSLVVMKTVPLRFNETCLEAALRVCSSV